MCFIGALAKIFVYSMSLDGPVRGETGQSTDDPTQQAFLAGSRSLDTLDKLVTSTESFFHPSNTGHWTLAVSGSRENLRICRVNSKKRVLSYSSQVSYIALRWSSASDGRKNSSLLARPLWYVQPSSTLKRLAN